MAAPAAQDVRMLSAPKPPHVVGAWRLASAPRQVAPGGIFDYMDGGGELYLAYRLARLDVCEYATPVAGEDGILVEVYTLRDSDDAYGLLSQDWGGEVVALAPDWPAGERRALYGAGLLRALSGNEFVRVMATLETDASRAAVLALGRALVAGRSSHGPPALVGLLPADVGGRWRARHDRHVFLRSHLVLNSAFFLATANVLGLGPEVEAVLVPYDDAQAQQTAERARLLLVRYPTPTAAHQALERFRAAYLPGETSGPAPEHGLVRIEDGWTGWRLSGRGLALVLAAPDEQAGGALLAGVDMGALAQAAAQ
jgi:hypothetical protein